MWTAFSNSVVPGGTPGRDFRLRVGRALLEAKSLLGDAGFCQPFGSLFGFLCIKKSILYTCMGEAVGMQAYRKETGKGIPFEM